MTKDELVAAYYAYKAKWKAEGGKDVAKAAAGMSDEEYAGLWLVLHGDGALAAWDAMKMDALPDLKWKGSRAILQAAVGGAP